MLDWLKARLNEASTYAGLGLIVSAVGVLGHVNEAPALAHAITAAGPSLSSGQYTVGLVSLIGGLLAAFKKG